MTLFHLALRSDWERSEATGRYRPAEGGEFVHCCDDLETVSAVARARFAHVTEPLVVLELDEAALDVEVRREPAADGRLFPHVYGSLPRSAVRAVRPL